MKNKHRIPEECKEPGGLYFVLAKQAIIKEVKKQSAGKRGTSLVSLSLDELIAESGDKNMPIADESDKAAVHDDLEQMRQHVASIPGRRGDVVRAAIAAGSFADAARKLGVTLECVRAHCVRAGEDYRNRKTPRNEQAENRRLLKAVDAMPDKIGKAVLAATRYGRDRAADYLGISRYTLDHRIRGAKYLIRRGGGCIAAVMLAVFLNGCSVRQYATPRWPFPIFEDPATGEVEPNVTRDK